MFTRLRFGKLWHHPNFLRLWIGSSISLLGSQITFIALPFGAALLLHATQVQMGILAVMNTVPNLLGGLFVGVWVDRMRRRPLLIYMDLARAFLLGSIPVVALFGVLRIEYLYVITFLVGVCSLFFDVAYEAFLPALIDQDQLVEGNSKLQASASTADFAGPGLAGFLVQWFTAPVALIFDALSYVISAGALFSLRIHEEKPGSDVEHPDFFRELVEGLRFTLSNQILRIFVGTTGVLNFTGGVFSALLVFYFVHDLGQGAAFYGLMYAVGSLSGIFAAFASETFIRKFGIGRVAVISALLIAIGWLLIPLINGSTLLVFVLIFAGALLSGVGNILYNVTASTLVQTTTPLHLLGRVRSVAMFIGLGTLPLGALLGGVLGSIIGSRTTLLAAGVVRLALLALLLIPLWKYNKLAPIENLQTTAAQELDQEEQLQHHEN